MNILNTLEIMSFTHGKQIDRKELLTYLVDRQYQRNDIEQTKGTFRVRGDVIEIVPGHTESWLIRIELFGDTVERISEVDPTLITFVSHLYKVS